MKLQIIKIISFLFVSTAVVGVPVFVMSLTEEHAEQTVPAVTTLSHETIFSAPSTISTEKEKHQASSDSNNVKENASENTSAAVVITRTSGKVTIKRAEKVIAVKQNATEIKTTKKYELEINELIKKYTNIYVAAVDYLENGGDFAITSEPSESTELPEFSEQLGMGASYCVSERCKEAEVHELDAITNANSLQEMKGTLEESVSSLKDSIIFYDQEQDVAENLEDLRALYGLLNDLIERYQSAIEDYSEEATTARLIKETEIANEIARFNSSGAIGSSVNTYPKADVCPRDNLSYGYMGGYVCQSVSYTGWKVYENYGIRILGWGNANTWHTNAKRAGYRVDHTPAVGTVAVTTGGAYGHVMWVEGINSNGTINLSEYNNSFSSKSGKVGDYGYRIGVSTAGMWFIHFE